MKQRITIEQLNELSDEQRKKLREWWNPALGDFYAYTKENVLSESLWDMVSSSRDIQDAKNHEFYPILSIGQMIELLSDSTNDWGLKYMDTSVDYFVYLGWNEEVKPLYQWRNDELCAALWSALKKVL